MTRVENKVAFITGAGRGQGRSHAIRLAEEGADVIATDACATYPAVMQYSSATEDDLEQTKLLVEKAGRRCVTAKADVRDRAALQAAVDAGVAELGRLDIVVGNAGVCTFHPSSLDIDEATYDLIVDTSLKGAWNTVQVTAPILIKQAQGGSMILTSSAAGLRGHAHYAHYSGAKHGVVGLMRAFANELAPHAIRVNTVHPTGVDGTGMGSAEGLVPLAETSHLMQLQATNMLPPEGHDLSGPWAPTSRVEPQDISAAVVFLASDEARFITGVTLPVDAGNTNKP
jgi:SDR family mycofactocin-dependent oxidoreductase